MKILTLTKDQKNKLLELCKRFFTEYNAFWIINKDQEEQYDEEDFVQMNVYTVNQLAKQPGFNRDLYFKIIKESEAMFESKTDKNWTWWHKDIVDKYAVQDIPKQPDICIHWYQLCLTELSDRIGKAAKGLAIETVREYTLRAKHPVDYLYTLAKTIK